VLAAQAIARIARKIYRKDAKDAKGRLKWVLGGYFTILRFAKDGMLAGFVSEKVDACFARIVLNLNRRSLDCGAMRLRSG
jgi:hypothetical protein